MGGPRAQPQSGGRGPREIRARMLSIVIQLGVDIAAGGRRDRELEPSGIVESRMAASEQVWAECLETHGSDYRV